MARIRFFFYVVAAVLLVLASSSSANRSFVSTSSRPAGTDLFFTNLVHRAGSSAAEQASSYMLNHEERTVSRDYKPSSLESLLRDAFFGSQDDGNNNPNNHYEMFASVRSVANIQATIIILAAAICLSLSPRRKAPAHLTEAVPGAHEIRDVLFSAISLGVMLIGTSISIASRHGSTSANSADIMFYGGITLSLACLALDTLLATVPAASQVKRTGLLVLSLGICVSLFYVCRPDDMFGENTGSMSVMKRLFSSSLGTRNLTGFNDSRMKSNKEMDLVTVLPMFAGLSLCFTAGFVVFLSCEFDNASMSAIGTMCLLQTMIAGASVLQSMVSNQIKGTLAQTSFAFILGMIILGTTLLPRVCEMQFPQPQLQQIHADPAHFASQDEEDLLNKSIVLKHADEKVILMKRMVYKHCNKNRTTCSPSTPMMKHRAVRFKEDAQLVEYFDSGL